MSNPQILITGASGNTGRAVVDAAIRAGVPIRAAYQSPDKAKAAPPGVEAVLVDFNQSGSLLAALDGIRSVFLVGPAAASVVELERRATDEIRRSHAAHLVKLSAMGPREVSFPGLHRASEDYIRSSGMPYTFLRPNGFMQNFVAYNRSTIREQGMIFGCQGDGKVSLIDLRDIGAVAVKVLTEQGHEGATYTLTGPEALTNMDVAEIFSRVLNREIRYVDLSEEQMRQGMLAAGMPEWSADSVLDLNRLYKNNGASEISSDVEKILGRRPASFEDFARAYRAEFV